MPTTALILLALGMSVDAGVAALGRGAVSARMQLMLALRLGLIFGVFEAAMPVLGWAAGTAAAPLLAAVDHWIAWALLTFIGLRMIRSGLTDHEDGAPRAHDLAIPALAVTAFATSVDAMAVGVSLAFADVPILPVALASGLATFAMATAGALIGSRVGPRTGGHAETGGGALLVLLGGWILVTQLLG
ncbi:MAG: manganese efflux pump MntP family protein [Celeribacter sp.]